jgi:nucleolar MIF4G domain-containing protein 1
LTHVAQFYASLVADGSLSITILKPVELPKLNAWSSIFVEWFILSLLRKCTGKRSHGDEKVERTFGPATEIPGLAAGLNWLLRNRIINATAVGHRERKTLKDVIEKAQMAVQQSPALGGILK